MTRQTTEKARGDVIDDISGITPAFLAGLCYLMAAVLASAGVALSVVVRLPTLREAEIGVLFVLGFVALGMGFHFNRRAAGVLALLVLVGIALVLAWQ